MREYLASGPLPPVMRPGPQYVMDLVPLRHLDQSQKQSRTLLFLAFFTGAVALTVTLLVSPVRAKRVHWPV